MNFFKSLLKQEYFPSKDAYQVIGDKVRPIIVDKGRVNGRECSDKFWRSCCWSNDVYFIPAIDIFNSEKEAKRELLKRLNIKLESLKVLINDLERQVNERS